jgi:hypothetical protein
MSLDHFPELARLTKRKRMQLADELWLSCVDDRSKTPKLATRDFGTAVE